MEQREFLGILSVAERLKDTMRHSYTSGGRRESVAEHSWRLALMAMLLKEVFPNDDMDKVIRMCLIHDLGEAFTGDIPAFLKNPDDSGKESDIFRNWAAGLPQDIAPVITSLWDEMEAQKTREARIYKALDKLEALIQHNEADIKTWLPLEYSLQRTYGTEECRFDPYISELRAEVLRDSERKIEEKQHE